MNMASEVFDVVKFEKEKAIARFNRLRRMARLWRISQILVFLGLFSWSSASVTVELKKAAFYLVEFSAYLLNHHVVFLIGNAIIASLFVLCRRSDAAAGGAGGGGADFYGDYVKHSEVAAAAAHAPEETTPYSAPAEEEKRIVECAATAEAEVQCDDVAAAIEEATRQIRRFQRTQSEKLKREIAVRPPRGELRRSETQKRRRGRKFSGEFNAAEMERLSGEEFQRRVEAFINKHWSKKEMKHKQQHFGEINEYQLMKQA